MTALNFPATPIDGQTYTLNGVYYIYDATLGAWVTNIIPRPLDVSNAINQQILFNDSGVANGSNGITFNKTTNTANFYNIVVTQNVIANTFSGDGSLLTNLVLTPANNYSGAMANSANVGTGTAANLYAAGVGTNANLYASSVGVRANNYAGVMANAANAYAASLTPDLTGANNYAGTMANAANAWANTKVAGVTSNSTARIWANTSITSGIETVYMDLATSGVTAASYGGTSSIPVVVVDAYGRVTSASNVSFTGGASIGDEPSSPSTYYPVFTSITSGTMSSANVDSGSLYFIPSTGTLSAGAFNSLSDISLKENINEIDGQALLDAIKPVSFTWKQSGIKSYGVIAQELEKTLPELVQTNEGIKSVSYTPMIAMLIDVVKKQQKDIEWLKDQLNKENNR